MSESREVSIIDRIARIENKAEIQDLIQRYALNIRNRVAVNCAALFTADATFETREGDLGDLASATLLSRLVGREAIIAHISGGPATQVRVCPSITNLLIDIDGETASSSCLMSARIWPTGQQIHGEYRDGFRRDEGVWRFQSRVYTMFRAAQS